MTNSGVCPRCGSTAIISPARLARWREAADGPIRVAVLGDPDAYLLKQIAYSDLEARVCSQCGYVELYAKDVASLSSASEKARSNLLHLTDESES
jgi:predicted nucleic-acid-binding Zn-ribbon protein